MTGDAFVHPLTQILFEGSCASAALGLALAALPRRFGPGPEELTAIVLVAAAIVTLQVNQNPVGDALVGLTALAMAGVMGRIRHLSSTSLGAWAIPGAFLLAYDRPLSPRWWVPVLAVAVIVIMSPLLVNLDRRRSRWAGVVVALSVGGVYATVPDTEQALALLGATVAVAAACWALRWRLGGAGIPALVGLVAWTVAVGGRGRAGSVVGGLTCLALLLSEPLGRTVAQTVSAERLRPVGTPAFLVVHTGAVLVASRVGGLRSQAGAAARVCVPVLMGAIVLYSVLSLIGPTPKGAGVANPLPL